MSTAETTARLTPYLQEALDNEEVREQLRRGASRLRAAYERSRKRRVKDDPEGALAYDLPSQPAVFAPGPEPGEIEEIAQKLREAAGLPKEPMGEVAN